MAGGGQGCDSCSGCSGHGLRDPGKMRRAAARHATAATAPSIDAAHHAIHPTITTQLEAPPGPAGAATADAGTAAD